MTSSAAAPGTPPAAGQETVVRGNAVWLPPGAPAVTVGGYAIGGGLFYFGSALPAAYASAYEPALVDPRLPIRRVRLDQETPADSDRPAYGELTAGARAAYLEWLAGGRVGTTAIAHLWLFLYGLERRVLVDLAGTLDHAEEYEAIAAELAALRTRYAGIAEFERQAGALADLVATLTELGDPALRPPPAPAEPRDELPMAVRVGLGRYVARAQPVSVAWAYTWHAHHPRRLREPAMGREEFAARYAAAYPAGGVVVPHPPDELVLVYQPANPGFAGRAVRVHTQLPDLRDLPAPFDEPANGSRPAEATPGAEPPADDPAADDLDLDALEAVVRRVRAREGHDVFAPSPARPQPRPATHDEPAAEPVAEPPPAEPLTPLFADRPLLAAAEALLRLVSLAGLTEDEFRAVRRYAVGALGLGVTDRHQLDDRLAEFARRRPTVDIIRRRFAGLRPAQHDAVAELLIATAGASGTVEPALFAVLDAVFTLLGTGSAELHRRLGEMEVASVSFDSTPGAPVNTTVLDPDTVERMLAAAPNAAALVDHLTAPVTPARPAPAWCATPSA